MMAIMQGPNQSDAHTIVGELAFVSAPPTPAVR